MEEQERQERKTRIKKVRDKMEDKLSKLRTELFMINMELIIRNNKIIENCKEQLLLMNEYPMRFRKDIEKTEKELKQCNELLKDIIKENNDILKEIDISTLDSIITECDIYPEKIDFLLDIRNKKNLT